MRIIRNSRKSAYSIRQMLMPNMNKVKDAIDKLTALTETSADALDGIKDTVNESATGVTDIAQKTSDMVEKTVDIHDKVTQCYGCADELNNIVAKFKLQ